MSNLGRVTWDTACITVRLLAGRLNHCDRLRVARRGAPLRRTYSILHHSIRFDSICLHHPRRDKRHRSLTFGAFLPSTVCH